MFIPLLMNGGNKCSSCHLVCSRVVVVGDGRNNSPGDCVTYCTYSFMDTMSNLILHQEIVDVCEANLKSPNMEKIGCKRGLDKLKENVNLKGLVTDDHNQISAMMSIR